MAFIELMLLVAAATDGILGETCREKVERLTEEYIDVVEMYIPQCKADGSYEEAQCYRPFGSKCWCVDRQGEMIPGSQGEYTELDCESYVVEHGCISEMTGAYHPEGSRWNSDPCTKCECLVGEESCYTTKCSKPNCPGAIHTPGTCCDYICPHEDDGRTVRIHGSVKLPGDGIYTHIPPGSCITVGIEEEIMDSAAERLAEFYTDLTEIKENVVEYELLVLKERLKPGMNYLISANINLGWCAKNTTDADDWIRKGDYFNDVSHGVRMPKEDFGIPGEFIKDIEVVAYGKSLCGRNRCYSTETCKRGDDMEPYCECPPYACPDFVEPKWVCGNDGQSYSSECWMKASVCFSDSVTKKHDGRCHRAFYKYRLFGEDQDMTVRVCFALGAVVLLTLVITIITIIRRKPSAFRMKRFKNEGSDEKEGKQHEATPKKTVGFTEVFHMEIDVVEPQNKATYKSDAAPSTDKKSDDTKQNPQEGNKVHFVSTGEDAIKSAGSIA